MFKRRKAIKKKTAYDEKYLWPIFSLFIRFRDTDKDGYGKCFTCSLRKHWSEADAGHGIGRQHKSVKYHEKNVHLQDKRCNGFEAGARDVYADEVDKKYGPNTWDYLTVQSKQVDKKTKFEFDVLTNHYVQEVIRLGKEKGIDATQLVAVKRWLNRKEK